MTIDNSPPIYRIRIRTWWGWTKKVYDVNEKTMSYLMVSLLSDLKYAHRGIGKRDRIVVTSIRKSWWKQHIVDEYPDYMDPDLF